MSEFSKEYLLAVGSSWEPDFSYSDELRSVQEGTVINRICEGFGSVGAILISNELYLLFSGSDPMKLSEVVEKFQSNQKTSHLKPFN